VSVAVLCAAPVAQAAFPGQNGKIAFETSRGTYGDSIYTANPDGTGAALLVDRSMSEEKEPAWSPDGTRLLFGSVNLYYYIWEVFSDGSGQRNVSPAPRHKRDATWSPDGLQFAYAGDVSGADRIFIKSAYTDAERELPTYGQDPAWSSDGSKIAFTLNTQFSRDIWTIDVDGTNVTNVTNSAASDEHSPDWSPDGSKIVYQRSTAAGSDIAVMNADGTDQTPLPKSGPGLHPVWSPDGTRIAFDSERDGDFDIYSIKADGSDLQQVTNDPGPDTEPSWQPLITAPPAGYPRPKGATTVRLSLVRAFGECTSPNRIHGPPLDSPSCLTFFGQSWLQTGTPDLNGAPANFMGNVRLRVIAGAPGGPDDSDVGLTLSVEDIRCNPSLSQLPCGGTNTTAGKDYLGELRASLPLRITDRDNTVTPNGSTIGTVVDRSLSVPFGCVDNSDVSIGSTCSLTTTIEAMIPGAVKEGKRAVWQLDRVVVYDGGPDGDVDTPVDEARLAVQGVFVP
jgi:Tol biopolymer transport system component